MWIKALSPATERIMDKDISDDYIEFSDNQKANVKKDVGKKLVKKYSGIVKCENEDKEQSEPEIDKEN